MPVLECTLVMPTTRVAGRIAAFRLPTISSTLAVAEDANSVIFRIDTLARVVARRMDSWCE